MSCCFSSLYEPIVGWGVVVILFGLLKPCHDRATLSSPALILGAACHFVFICRGLGRHRVVQNPADHIGLFLPSAVAVVPSSLFSPVLSKRRQAFKAEPSPAGAAVAIAAAAAVAEAQADADAEYGGNGGNAGSGHTKSTPALPSGGSLATPARGHGETRQKRSVRPSG